MRQETVTRHGKTFTVTTINPAEPRKRSACAGFVKVPEAWVAKLAGQDGRVYDVALKLLWLNFKSYKRSFKLTNPAVGGLKKMDRRVKYRVLKKLEQLRLISVERQPGKAPLITLITK